MNHVIGSIDIESHLHMVGSTYFDGVTSKDSGGCVSFWMVVLKHLEISQMVCNGRAFFQNDKGLHVNRVNYLIYADRWGLPDGPGWADQNNKNVSAVGAACSTYLVVI